MKRCKICNIEKNESEFYINSHSSDNLSSWCKECQREDKRNHYKNNKEKYQRNQLSITEWFLKYKNNLKCERCGFSHPAALDFHHKDPTTKKFSIGQLKGVKNKDIIMEEIKKCEVICSNCHRIEHAKHYNEYLKKENK